MFANNLIFVDDAKKKLVDAGLSTEGLTCSQNLFFGAELAPELPGLQENPQLEATNGRFSLPQISPAVDAALGDFDFVETDFEHQPRPKEGRDIGADEFVADKVTKPAVLSREHVGTTFLDRLKEKPAK